MRIGRISERASGPVPLHAVRGKDMLWTPRTELVKGILVQRARPTSLYALPGVGKGNVAIYILLSISHGLPVFGFETKPVDWYAYIDGEDDQAEFERRACRVATGLGVALDDTLHYVEVPYKLNTSRARSELEKLLAEWSTQGEGVVVYDSAQALFGGNQVSGEVGDAVYSQVKCWGQQYHHTPLIIDHAPKGSDSRGGKVYEYGSMYKGARVGASLYLRQVEAIDACTTLIDLYNPKSNTRVVDTTRNAEPLVRFRIRFDDRSEGAISFETVCGEAHPLEALPREPFTVPQAAEIWGLSEKRTSQRLNAYYEKGLLERERAAAVGRGQPRYLYRRLTGK